MDKEIDYYGCVYQFLTITSGEHFLPTAGLCVFVGRIRYVCIVKDFRTDIAQANKVSLFMPLTAKSVDLFGLFLSHCIMSVPDCFKEVSLHI